MAVVIAIIAGLAVVIVAVVYTLLRRFKATSQVVDAAQAQFLAQGGGMSPTGQPSPYGTPAAVPGQPVPGQVPGAAAFPSWGGFSHLVGVEAIAAQLQQFGITIDPERLKNAQVVMSQPQVFTLPTVVAGAGMVAGATAGALPGWAEGTATVASIASMGVTVNEQSLVHVEADIVLAGTPSFHVSSQTMAPSDKVALVSPGESIPVLVNPGDHNQIAIEWDRAT